MSEERTMIYLISKLWPFMVLAFVAGTVVGWRRRDSSAG
jgi:hypothetical protein